MSNHHDSNPGGMEGDHDHAQAHADGDHAHADGDQTHDHSESGDPTAADRGAGAVPFDDGEMPDGPSIGGAVPFPEGDVPGAPATPDAPASPEPPATELESGHEAVVSGDVRQVILRSVPEDRRSQRRGDVTVYGTGDLEVRAATPDNAKHPGSVQVDPTDEGAIVWLDGDATVHLPAGAALIAEGPFAGSLNIQDVSGTIEVGSVGNSLKIGSAGSLSIEQVGNHLAAADVGGPVHIDRVGSHLKLRNVDGPVRLGTIGGHAKVQDVRGPLQVERVGGHLKVQDVRGAVHLDRVGGHLRASGIAGALRADVGGHARIQLDGVHPCKVRAGGAVKCQLPEGAGVDATLKAGGVVSVRADEVQEQGGSSRHFEGRIGSGGTPLELKAGGAVKVSVGDDAPRAGRSRRRRREREIDIDLEDAAEAAVEHATRLARDFETIAEDVSVRIGRALGLLDERTKDLDLGEQELERIQQKVSRMGERIATKVERNVGRAVMRASRAAQRRARRPETARPASTPQARSAAEAVAGDDATGDEVMTILRMVEESRISAEEAEKLLSALKRGA